MTRYEEDGRRERRVWRTLVTAACGHIVCAVTWDDRDAAYKLDEYVAALEGIGLESSAWSVRKTNGDKRILFENGGEVRFISRKSPHLRGTRADVAVVDA